MNDVDSPEVALEYLAFAMAQRNLAGLCYYGRGVQRDYRAAAQWLRLAADQGDVESQFRLAVLYAEGKGGPADYPEAMQWFRMAAAKEHPGP